jgi:hypothetical protein
MMASRVWVGGSEIRPIRGTTFRAKSARRGGVSTYGPPETRNAATEATILMPGGSFNINEFPALKHAVEHARSAT